MSIAATKKGRALLQGEGREHVIDPASAMTTGADLDACTAAEFAVTELLVPIPTIAVSALRLHLDLDGPADDRVAISPQFLDRDRALGVCGQTLLKGGEERVIEEGTDLSTVRSCGRMNRRLR